MEQYDKVLSLYQEWIDDYETEAYWVTNDIVYDDTSNAFYYSNNYNAAISVSNKRLDNLKKWDEKIEDDEERKDWLFSYTMANAMLGYCHMKQDRTSLAENDFINAAVAYRFYLDVDAEDVNLGKVKDPLLGSFYYAMAANHTYLSSSYIVLMCTACKCGYEPAIELLRSTGRYNEYMSLFESTVLGK